MEPGQPFERLQLHDFGTFKDATADACRANLGVLLPSGVVAPLRTPQAQELSKLFTNTSTVDAEWLQADTRGVRFKPHHGAAPLPVVFVTQRAALAPPPLTRSRPAFAQGPETAAPPAPFLPRPAATDVTDAGPLAPPSLTRAPPARPSDQGGETRAASPHTPVARASGESLHLVIDQSSSMASMNGAAYEGARELVESTPDGVRVAFTTFSDRVTLGDMASREQALLQLARPRVAVGSTALRDAMVRVISLEETRLHERTTVVLVTDGQDTCSRESVSATKAAVERFQARAGCRILFLGSNQDAVLEAAFLGIAGNRALTFGGTSEDHMHAAFRAASENASAFRSLGTDEFTAVQRQRSVAGEPTANAPEPTGNVPEAARARSLPQPVM